ncbi:glycosyltransferase family 4 protein [Burkholderia ubonensis]|uniref:glycosyltransferase family 4 protein n=1 Tax=Burkholderia ubonensis TaxID=101571 RepID=UPI001E2B2422|nr:glycosyltransferase family 1 protein [Burkholderia ubonensis]
MSHEYSSWLFVCTAAHVERRCPFILRLKFMRHRLFFDVTELAEFDKGTGIQRVTRALLHALRQKTPVDWKVIPVRGDGVKGHFVTATALAERQLAGNLDPSVEIAIEPAKGDIFLSVDLAYNITPSLRQELVRFRAHGVGVYFVVYDLIPLMYPEWFEGTNAWFEGNDYLKLFNFWFECVREESDGMICISDAVRKDVISWLERFPPTRRDQPKLEYFHLGSDITESLPSRGLPTNAQDVLAQLKSSTTFLMVGTLEPRKGHELALDAIEKLWADGRDVKLVFVGRAGWKVEHLTERIKRHSNLNRRLFWLDGISDEYLRQVYMASSALFALSLAEGFGLPLVEAAHFKLPLIVRDIPVFREICRNAATYFSGESSEDLKALLVEWLAKRNSGQCRLPDGMKVLSWPESAQQLMAAVGRMRDTESFWSVD